MIEENREKRKRANPTRQISETEQFCERETHLLHMQTIEKERRKRGLLLLLFFFL